MDDTVEYCLPNGLSYFVHTKRVGGPDHNPIFRAKTFLGDDTYTSIANTKNLARSRLKLKMDSLYASKKRSIRSS